MRLTDSEWTVMNAVWARSPASARDVLEATADRTEWAYTTVKTLLDRLVEKGVLTVRKRANTGLYEPRLSREDARRSALRGLVDRAFGGTFDSLFQHMVREERLPERDRERLASLLDDLDAEEHDA